ncbi:MAG: pyridoxal phosphate-dependent aminotransferase [Deltaproteobacteria bacterium]|nr:pyridoxal phosphate-dependent aminotransferase [Deltaproteobacteria bacterium]
MTMLPKTSNRIGQIPKSAIHEMTRLSKQISDVAFLSWAKPTSGAPEHIRQAAAKAVTDGLTDGYSETAGLPVLRQAIVDKLERDNHIVADPSQILVTVGAIEGLSAALMAVLDPGDEVILPSPTYSTHVNQIRIASGTPVFVPLIEDKGFALDPAGIERAITPRTKAILYCSPSNPTGSVFSQHELEQVAEIALKHNLVVITDEAYEYFVFDGHKHFSIGSIPDMAEHAISCFTFTKSYAMTGWRVGYLHASKNLVPQIGKAHIAFAICAPVASQYAALAALTGSQDCIETFKSKYESARNLMCRRLDRLPHVFSYHKPAGSYLMFPKILTDDGTDSAAFCKSLLQETHVSTTPGSDFGPTAEGHLRLSFCVDETMIETAFDRMDRYFPKVS